jgi:hypothetical protein
MKTFLNEISEGVAVKNCTTCWNEILFFCIMFLLIFWGTSNFQDEQLKYFLTSGSILEYLHAQFLTKHHNVFIEGNYSFPVVQI